MKLGDHSKGDGLKKVQQAMTDMRFALPNSADGKYGPLTKTAITNFQVNAVKMFPAVKPTGVLDKATMTALDNLAPQPGEQGQSLNIQRPTSWGAMSATAACATRTPTSSPSRTCSMLATRSRSPPGSAIRA